MSNSFVDNTVSIAENTSWTKYVAIAAKWKELILFPTATLFLLGYATLVINSYVNNLGFIPPLQVQCIMAGIIPSVFITAVLIFLKVWLFCEEKTIVFLVSHRKISFVAFFAMIVYSAWGMIVSPMYAFDITDMRRNIILLIMMMIFVSGLKMLILVPYRIVNATPVSLLPDELLGDTEARHRQLNRRPEVPIVVMKIFTFAGAAQFMLVMVVSWLFYAYPRLPQEFGGMQPRTAFFAVSRAQLSPEMRQAIMPLLAQKLPVDPSKDPLAVAQTRLLDVVYENNDALMVRIHADRTDLISKLHTVYQIKKTTIQGVSWCGYDYR